MKHSDTNGLEIDFRMILKSPVSTPRRDGVYTL